MIVKLKKAGCSITLLYGVFSMLSGCASMRTSQERVTYEDYARAEAFLPWNLEKLIQHERVVPEWIDNSHFWYKDDTRRGDEYWQVDILQKKRFSAFDQVRLAASLSAAVGEEVNPYKLAISELQFEEEGKAISFEAKGKRWRLKLTDYTLEQRDTEKKNVSPDGLWEALIKNHNLWIRSTKTGQEIALSRDGEANYAYGVPVINPFYMIQQGKEQVELDPGIKWSDDSKKILTYKIDKRDAETLSLVQTRPVKEGRPKTFRYVYALAGDEKVPMAEAYVFHIESKKRVKLNFPADPVLYYGAPWYQWYKDSKRVVFMTPDRGYQRFRLFEADAYSGRMRTIIEEKTDNFLDYYAHEWYEVRQGEEYLWASERDGWNHLYRYDGKSGQMLNQVTRGEWRFRNVVHVDEKRDVIFLLGGGREPERDPYLRHLYRVNLDGSGFKLLTPEPHDHDVYLSPDGDYIVDNYSRVDAPVKTVIRRSTDGEIIMDLQQADIQDLLAKKYIIPEPFKVKAADGVTDIYGTLYRPSNLDPGKRYPVIDNIYSGPHYVMARKTFYDYHYSVAESLAEIGFIVMHVDGRGTSKRSKAFHQLAYKNLGAVGLDDHEAAIRELAKRYSYIDIDRVGIFGFSAGGYDTVRAMFRKPDFYKVGVAASGNHDLRMDKAVWNEQWMGYPLGPEYERDSNMNGVKNLKGKLLIAHGELDENVNPMNTLQLADALIKANKNFDMLIMPGEGHVFSVTSPYFQRIRWDYFVRHLMHAEPPKEYHIQRE